MSEIWRPVVGYEGLYEVSNYGNVRVVEHYILNRWGSLTLWKSRIRKPQIDKYGYCCVNLTKDSNNYRFTIHRLMCKAFIPNPNNYPCINHKDENKQNNFIYVNPDGTIDIDKSNLEWCTNEYNLKYGHRLEKVIKKRKTPILQFTKEMEFVAYYESATDASKLNGFSMSGISQCLNGKLKSSNGFIWKYAD